MPAPTHTFTQCSSTHKGMALVRSLTQDAPLSHHRGQMPTPVRAPPPPGRWRWKPELLRRVSTIMSLHARVVVVVCCVARGSFRPLPPLPIRFARARAPFTLVAHRPSHTTQPARHRLGPVFLWARHIREGGLSMCADGTSVFSGRRTWRTSCPMRRCSLEGQDHRRTSRLRSWPPPSHPPPPTHR